MCTWDPSPRSNLNQSSKDQGNSLLEEDTGTPQSETDSDDSIVQHLHLEDNKLQLYGPTSIYQFMPKVSQHVSRSREVVKNPSGRYVLDVDGVDESDINPHLDWSRYLPSEVNLDRKEHDKLLDLLFKFITSSCFRVVPALFLRDMYRALIVPRSQPSSMTPHYSPALHNALIAVAASLSEIDYIRDLRTRQYFAKRAKNYIDEEGGPGCPNITTVHALSLLGTFHSTRGDKDKGYIYFGRSAKISQMLGLGVDCSSWVKERIISHDDMLDRNWAYWTTFCKDVSWALYVGREFSVSLADKRIIPLPFSVDSELDHEMVWHYPPSRIPPQPSFLTVTFAETCELSRIARQIVDLFNKLSSTRGPDREAHLSTIKDIDTKLHGWKCRIRPEVDITPSNQATATPHCIILHLTHLCLYIVLHRPFYHKTSASYDHAKTCNAATNRIMELVGTWSSLYPLRYAPMIFVQIVFSAGTIFVHSAVQATSTASHSISQVNLCIGYLRETGKSLPSANNIADILESFLNERLKPRFALTRIPQPASNPSYEAPVLRGPMYMTGANTTASTEQRWQVLRPGGDQLQLAPNGGQFGGVIDDTRDGSRRADFTSFVGFDGAVRPRPSMPFEVDTMPYFNGEYLQRQIGAGNEEDREALQRLMDEQDYTMI